MNQIQYDLPRTKELPESGKMPPLNTLFNIEDLQDLHVLVAVCWYFIIGWLENNFGFDRITGSNHSKNFG